MRLICVSLQNRKVFLICNCNVIIKESSLQTPQSSLLHVTWRSCKVNRGLTPSCTFPTNWREITTRLPFNGLKKCKVKPWPACITSGQKSSWWKRFFGEENWEMCTRMFNMVCQCLDSSHRNAGEEKRTWQIPNAGCAWWVVWALKALEHLTSHWCSCLTGSTSWASNCTIVATATDVHKLVLGDQTASSEIAASSFHIRETQRHQSCGSRTYLKSPRTTI